MKTPKVNKNERNEAKQTITERLDEIDRKLRNLSDALRKSHENEREILTWVSDETEKHQPRDGRNTSPTRTAMVMLTALKVHNSCSDRASTIKHTCFALFKPIPGSYENFNSFNRAVDRHLWTHLLKNP